MQASAFHQQFVQALTAGALGVPAGPAAPVGCSARAGPAA
ncbi:Uncharacterised protein [Mycobacterium tuberculosis]|nr:Uncharacterised protein [Mycobacterium tuberculosis]